MIRSAPTPLRLLFFSVVLLFPVVDLITAYLYHISGWKGVGLIRNYRDMACIFVSLFGYFSRYLPYQVRLSLGLYGVLLAFYSVAALLMGSLPISVIITSLGTLLIPPSITLAAFAVVRTPRDMGLLVKILGAYAIASALFGIWEIRHTEFWTSTINLGQYIWEVKAITTGFQSEQFLPWNFVGFNELRRAAGLLAAPLAQGFFLAVVGLVGFAYLRRRHFLLACVVAAICFYGVNMSATRGALLALVLASVFYFFFPHPERKMRRANIVIASILAVLSFEILAYYYIYTVRGEDASTPGHIAALQRNLADIDQVAVIGSGIGAAGGRASSVGLEIQGGGEGAIFSIAYQIGIPGALIFLWFMWRLAMELFQRRRDGGTGGELARALSFLFIGVAASTLTSEHILTFSGMGAFWLLVGGYLGYACRRDAIATQAAPPQLYRYEMQEKMG